jgi:predicted nucleotidyltransferase
MGLVVRNAQDNASLRLYDRNRTGRYSSSGRYRPLRSFRIRGSVIPESAALDRVVEALAKRIAQQTIRGSYTDLLTPVEKGRKP